MLPLISPPMSCESFCETIQKPEVQDPVFKLMTKEDSQRLRQDQHPQVDWTTRQDQCGIHHLLSTLERLVPCPPKLYKSALTGQAMMLVTIPLCRLDTNLPVKFQGGLKGDVGGHHAYIFYEDKA